MNTAELKIDLINKIASMTDEIKLREILQLLEFQADKSMFETSKEDKKAIMEAQEQITKEQTLTDEEVRKEIKKCLNR